MLDPVAVSFLVETTPVNWNVILSLVRWIINRQVKNARIVRKPVRSLVQRDAHIFALCHVTREIVQNVNRWSSYLVIVA